MWDVKGQDGVISESTVTAELHDQRVSHTPFGGEGWRDAYAPQRVAIHDEIGDLVGERYHPRDSFVGHTLTTPWDRLHLAYFSGYAMWTYLTQPFHWDEWPVEIEELDPWVEGEETWRRLRVMYPPSVATHSAENVYYVDDSLLIRRHDYAPEVLGLTDAAAHYSTRYANVQGIQVATQRRVYPTQPDGSPRRELLLVSIDLHDIVFV